MKISNIYNYNNVVIMVSIFNIMHISLKFFFPHNNFILIYY